MQINVQIWVMGWLCFIICQFLFIIFYNNNMGRVQLLAFLQLFIILGLLQYGQATLSGKLGSKGIKMLTDKNFRRETGITFNDYHKKLPQDSDWLILFFANWCDYSKQFAQSVYLSIRNITDNIGFDVTPAAVQCPSNPWICDSLHVNAYPRLLYFPSKGGRYKFPNREKTKENVIQFIKKAHEKIHIDIVQQKQLEQQKQGKIYQRQTPANQPHENKDIQDDQNEKSIKQGNNLKQSLKQMKPRQNKTNYENYLLETAHLKQKLLILLFLLLLLVLISALLAHIASRLKRNRNSTKMLEIKGIGQNVYVANNSQIQSAQSERTEMCDQQSDQISIDTKQSSS